MSKICFYYIDKNYLDFLKSYEKKQRGFTNVPNIEYANNEKFFYGTVLNVNDINYYVPVSSKTKGKQDDILIKDKKGVVKSSLRFNFMIPVPNAYLTRLEIKGNFSDNEAIRIKSELAFCRRNKDAIEKKAEKTYERINDMVSSELNNNSCDFKLLEEAYIIYCHDNNLSLPEQLEKQYNSLISDNVPVKSTAKNTEKLTEKQPEQPQKPRFSISRKKANENAKFINQKRKEQEQNSPTPQKPKKNVDIE